MLFSRHVGSRWQKHLVQAQNTYMYSVVQDVCRNAHSTAAGQFQFETAIPNLDYEYLCDPQNKCEIEENIRKRKGIGNINLVHELHKRLDNMRGKSESVPVPDCIASDLHFEAFKIPNKSSDVLKDYGENAVITRKIGEKTTSTFPLKEFSDLAKRFNLVRTENLGNLSGHRSYYFMGELAEMEQALIKLTVKTLRNLNFQLVSVPDMLHSDTVESCGMSTKGERTQVYMLDPLHYGPDLCLSGTSEMALAGLFLNTTFSHEHLPKKLAAVSRCYRAETSSLAEERGIYRVHQFTKVEMFGIMDQQSSAGKLEEFLKIQETLFSSLGLHFQILDMPPHELGAPAHRKFDVEAWLPGRQMYGEISSCSDCTDYQARRLNIRYLPGNSSTPVHAHTINGTACAVPRMLIALLETHQRADGSVSIPEALRPFMNGKTVVGKQLGVPDMKYMRSKHRDAKKH